MLDLVGWARCLLDEPLSPFVAEFVGLNNKVPVQVSGLVVAA